VRTTELELLPGTLDLFVLKALSWEPMHGLGVLRALDAVTRGELQIEEGALYPALHRLEEQGLLDAVWGTTEKNRKAKFYRLTTVGRRRLTAEISKWSRYSKVVRLILTTVGAP
jgi:transcriptional regulator